MRGLSGLCPGIGDVYNAVQHRGMGYYQSDAMELRSYNLPPITLVGDEP
jgi:hypothetical protein